MVIYSYVDDMIITEDDIDRIQATREYLQHQFEMKDQGSLRYFLGLRLQGLPASGYMPLIWLIINKD